jgi:type I restriction enzyme S subunit
MLQTLNFDELSTGVAIPRVNRDDLYQKKILVPPLPEQRAIADYLDRETAKLDELISTMEELLDCLLEKHGALISHAVTRGLNPNVAMRDSDVAWLGEIPAHWDVTRIAFLFRERKERNQPHLPRLNVSIHTGVTLDELSDPRYEQEDLALYKVARAGDIAFNKTRMWQGAVGTVPRDGKVSPEYIVAASIADIDTTYYGELFGIGAFSAEAARYSRGITWDRYRLYWPEFRDIRVPVPPLNEQGEIVNDMAHETMKLDDLHTTTKSTIEFLHERRRALITAVIFGEIRVTK